jgi:membrane protease YdiL (CAAX protease family)
VILSASALFAVVHLGAAPAYALPALFTIGVILGWWYEKTGSLWPCIAAHAAFNALSLLATLAMSGALTEPPTG